MQKKWRLLEKIENSGAMQMAIDEAILQEKVEQGTLRFYSWKPVCLTIGYFQDLLKEVDVDRCKNLGVDVVRRYTGGGAVLHDDEITYSICVSETKVPSDILESYRFICSAIIKTLARYGVQADFSGVNDVCVNGRKISGNAQTRKNGMVLQHGTLLCDVDVDKVFSVLKLPDEKAKYKLVKDAKDRLVTMKQLLGKSFLKAEFENVLKEEFAKLFRVEFLTEKLTGMELETANSLFNQKYSQERWTYGY